VQADDGDLRHPCPGAHGAHPGGSHGRGRCGARCPTASTRERKAEREKEKQGWVADVWGPLGGDSKEW
jgi:hypothetical protein